VSILLLNKVEAMTVEKSYIESQPQAGLGWYKTCLPGSWHRAANMIVLLAIASKPSLRSAWRCFRDGPGTGPNLPYYHDIHWIGIEPNPYMHSYLKKEAD